MSAWFVTFLTHTIWWIITNSYQSVHHCQSFSKLLHFLQEFKSSIDTKYCVKRLKNKWELTQKNRIEIESNPIYVLKNRLESNRTQNLESMQPYIAEVMLTVADCDNGCVKKINDI